MILGFSVLKAKTMIFLMIYLVFSSFTEVCTAALTNEDLRNETKIRPNHDGQDVKIDVYRIL